MTSTVDKDTATKTYDQFVGGEWVGAVNGAVYPVLSPRDGSVFANVPASGRADMKAAVAAANRAQPEWAALPPSEKQALFLRAAELLEERAPELVRALAEETGAGYAFSMYQMTWSAQLMRLAAGWVYDSKGEILPTDFPHTVSIAERKPLGVVACFTPWNGANLLTWRAVILPLVAGNTVVVKPSEESPFTGGIAVAQVLQDAGFPAGTINVVTHAPADAAEVAEELYENPAVRCIFFTGSARTARVIAAKAGAALKRTVMELGGYNHIMVLDDADVDQAAKITAFSSFLHQGQTCMSARRVLVQESLYDEFVERLRDYAQQLPVGDPLEQSTMIGPLINQRAAATVRNNVDAARAAGARVVAGGTNSGDWFEPTIIVDAPDDHEISCEETFGPVVVIRPIRDEAEGIDLVNANKYGLSFSVLTGDTSRGVRVASRIHSGAVHVNGPTIDDEPHMPNGGTKESGWGRSGAAALDEFTEVRWMTVELETRQMPF